MKRFPVAFLLSALVLAGCGKTENQETKATTPPATNDYGSGNPITAPVDYLGAINQAQKSSVSRLDLIQIKQAIQQFNAGEGRLPKDINELIQQKYLIKANVPRGMKIDYNPNTGDVNFVPAK
jgi:hypothetical protein